MSASRLGDLARTTMGLTAQYTTVDGKMSSRTYLDSAATTLPLGCVEETSAAFLEHYASTHTNAHFAAKIVDDHYHQAHVKVLDFVGADAQYGCFFIGQGTTAAMNRIAAVLSNKRPERRRVMVSVMEHHSNDLPHRLHHDSVFHIPLSVTDDKHGGLDIAAAERYLEQYGDEVNYIAVTALSNVTGIVNPIHQLAALAHAHGALIVVDAAQMVAHLPINVVAKEADEDIDVLAFSAHKIYAPSGPGVVVGKMIHWEDTDPVAVGGSMVDDVYLDRYFASDEFTEREEAGTPDIPGAIKLGCALDALQWVGFASIVEHETALMTQAMELLTDIPKLTVYGDTDPLRVQRIGAISFNIEGMHHALLASILNDYFNIAVRNACFCAHPYVREMVSADLEAILDSDAGEAMSNPDLERLADNMRGMVRASFGIYSKAADVSKLAQALRAVAADPAAYAAQYTQDIDDRFQHQQLDFKPRAYFDASAMMLSKLESSSDT